MKLFRVHAGISIKHQNVFMPSNQKSLTLTADKTAWKSLLFFYVHRAVPNTFTLAPHTALL